MNLKVLRLFSAAVMDQIMLSAVNLVVGFVLIRFTSDFDYGAYVLVQSALLLLCSGQGAWIAGPLAVIVPRTPAEKRPALLGGITAGQKRFLRRLAMVAPIVPVVGYLSGRCSGVVTMVLFGAIVAAWGALRRDFLRNVLMIYSRPNALLRADSIYAGVLLVGVLMAAFGTHNAIIWVTLALAAAAWAGTVGAHRAIAADPGWVQGDATEAWREVHAFGVWSLLGGVFYWLFGQSYSYVLATRLDLAAVTSVNAVRLLLMPVFVLTIGMQALLVPTAAKWNAELGFRSLMLRLLGMLVVVGALDLIYVGIVWMFRDWLIVDVLHKHILDRDRLLLLWAGVALVGLMRDILQCSLIALGRFKSLAGQVGLSAVVALTLMWFGTAWWGSAAVLIGQIAGELVNLVGIVMLLRTHARLPVAAAAPSTAA